MTDEAGVHRIVRDLMGAWNLHDARTFAALFAPDADFTNVVGMFFHGREEIERFHAPLFASRFVQSHQSAEDVRIRWLAPELASVDVRWAMTGVRDERGQERPVRHGVLHIVASKRSGKWEIDVVHNTEVPVH